MATRSITGGATRPSITVAAVVSMFIAAAIGSAPIWVLLAGGS